MTVTLTRKPAAIERIAPKCDLKGCEERADYFWLLLPAAKNRMGWLPVCHRDATDLVEQGLVLQVVPLAEQSNEAQHHPPLEPES